MSMNLPNKLTIFRCILIVPFVALLLNGYDLFATIIFVIASLTDLLDGKIARKYNLVTNFGKFMDTLADKALVFSAFLVIASMIDDLDGIMIWACVIVFIRELGVTSIRLVCASSAGKVIAANFFGKAKTVTQMTCILVILVEYALIEGKVMDLGGFNYVASFITTILMAFMTVASGINYLKTYLPYMDPNK